MFIFALVPVIGLHLYAAIAQLIDGNGIKKCLQCLIFPEMSTLYCIETSHKNSVKQLSLPLKEQNIEPCHAQCDSQFIEACIESMPQVIYFHSFFFFLFFFFASLSPCLAIEKAKKQEKAKQKITTKIVIYLYTFTAARCILSDFVIF